MSLTRNLLRGLTATSRRNWTASPSLSPTFRSFSTGPARQASRRYVGFKGDAHQNWRWDSTAKILAFVTACGGVYYVAHLEQVPETGRWRFMDISPKFESKLASAAHAQLVQEFKGKILPPNHPVTQHVRKVIERLLDANNLGTLKSARRPESTQAPGPESIWDVDSGFATGRTEEVNPGVGGSEWELMVVKDDKTVNAMASYGNIVVFTGILPVARDEDGLATVLGHEIAHVVARHSSERYSSSKIFLLLISLFAISGFDIGLSRIASSLLFELPNSRTQELEADSIGLKILAKACFNPQAAPEMFKRMGESEKASKTIDFLYTHPSSERRVKRLNEILPEAYAIRAASPECANTTAFQNSYKTFTGGDGPTMIWRYA